LARTGGDPRSGWAQERRASAVTGSGISEELDAMEIDRVFSCRRSEPGGTHRDRFRCERPDLPSTPGSVCRAVQLNAAVILDLFPSNALRFLSEQGLFSVDQLGGFAEALDDRHAPGLLTHFGDWEDTG